MIMKEKNKLLQERDLVGEIEKLNMKIVKGVTTRGIRDDEKTYAMSEVNTMGRELKIDKQDCKEGEEDKCIGRIEDFERRMAGTKAKGE